MPRIIIHARNSPFIHRTAKGDTILICMCGLSGNYPLCDGSHLKTDGEEAGIIYLYNQQGSRIGKVSEIRVEEGEVELEEVKTV